MLNNDLRHKFVDTLIKIPALQSFEGRTALLYGLPQAALNRSPGITRLDLEMIITQLDELGRLYDEGGTRPLIVVAENALTYVPPLSAVGRALAEIIQALETYYGGEQQVAPVSQPLPGEEVVIGHDDRLRITFLQGALHAVRSVARIQIPRIFDGVAGHSSMYGTGWLIAPGLLITNYHVIKARSAGEVDATPQDLDAQAQAAVFWFDYQAEAGIAASLYLECQQAELVAYDAALDFAVLRIRERDKIADREPLRLIPQQPKLQRGDRLNILQHGNGGPLQLAIRNNFYVGAADDGRFLRYVTDTEPGASGSPLLDDNWMVVGLHHAAIEAPATLAPREVFKDELIRYVNEGIAIHKIIDSLRPELVREIRTAQGWS